MSHAPTSAKPPASKGFLGIGFSQWILISMVVGILIGTFAPDIAVNLKPFANIFLRMIKSLIVPLLFSTLVVGIAGHGDDMKKVGRLALRSIIYFEIVTTAALAIGLIAVNLVKPGVGVKLESGAGSEEFKALGGEIQAGDIAKLDDLGDDIDRVGVAWQGVKNQVVIALVPVLKDMVTGLLTWVKANRELLQQKLTGFISSLAGVLRLAAQAVAFAVE